MATTRLYNAMQSMATDPTRLRNDQALSPTGANVARIPTNPNADDSVFIAEGVIVAVHDRAGYLINFRGATAFCAQATDEPLRVGQDVFLSKTRDGRYIIHGSVR